MATTDTPADLDDLRSELDAARDKHKALLGQWPSSTAIVDGTDDASPELRAQTDAAWARVLELTVAIDRTRTAQREAASVAE